MMKWLRLGQLLNTGFSDVIVSPFSWMGFFWHYLGWVLLLYFFIINYCEIYNLEKQAFTTSEDQESRNEVILAQDLSRRCSQTIGLEVFTN